MAKTQPAEIFLCAHFPTSPSASATWSDRRRSDLPGLRVTLETAEDIGSFAAQSHNTHKCQRRAVYLCSEDGPHASFKDRGTPVTHGFERATLAAVCEPVLVMTLASMSTLSILRV